MNGANQSCGTADNPRLREFLETARRLKSERASIGDTVQLLLRTRPIASLADEPRLRTNAALERLGQESRDLLEKKPQDALAIAELATTIADSLADDAYPAAVLAQIRAAAWKDRANALRYVSRLDEAYDAISRAEKTLKSHPGLVVDRAVVDLVKALILWELGETAEAHLLLHAAELVFMDVGDAKKVRQARVIDASVLYNEGKYAGALSAWTSLLKEASSEGDGECIARLHNNLGYCEIHLGRFVEANIDFSEAIARFTDLGFEAEAARTQRGAGQLLIEKGQTAAGLVYLRNARSSFAQFRMVREAGLCGLRIAEALFQAGDTEGARAMTDEIRREFAAARFSHVTLEKLASLERAIAADEASVESIRGVHGFIAALRDESGAPAVHERASSGN